MPLTGLVRLVSSQQNIIFEFNSTVYCLYTIYSIISNQTSIVPSFALLNAGSAFCFFRGYPNVDEYLVRGFPFVSGLFFFRESYV